jgi:NifU-like protein involved in Fe-S cluster formation
MASASALCELAAGKSVDKALQITTADITAAIGALPEGKGHAPAEAIQALKKAIEGES